MFPTTCSIAIPKRGRRGAFPSPMLSTLRLPTRASAPCMPPIPTPPMSYQIQHLEETSRRWQQEVQTLRQNLERTQQVTRVVGLEQGTSHAPSDCPELQILREQLVQKAQQLTTMERQNQALVESLEQVTS